MSISSGAYDKRKEKSERGMLMKLCNIKTCNKSLFEGTKCSELLKQVVFNPLPDDKILDWSKLNQIADNIFKVHLKWKISII